MALPCQISFYFFVYCIYLHYFLFPSLSHRSNLILLPSLSFTIYMIHNIFHCFFMVIVVNSISNPCILCKPSSHFSTSRIIFKYIVTSHVQCIRFLLIPDFFYITEIYRFLYSYSITIRWIWKYHLFYCLKTIQH